MIIKLNKLHFLIALTFILSVSFIFAMVAENESRVTSGGTSVKIPIIMYHHMTENKTKAGAYTILTEEFESDIKYLKEKGYTAVTTEDLINYVYNGESLPAKCIMITFDDGFESFYALAYPILQKYSMKSVMSVIGSASDLATEVNDHNINYSNLTWDEIKELHESGLVDIQSHTYDLHGDKDNQRRGMKKVFGESDKVYEDILRDDLMKMQELLRQHIGKKATAIAYPYGALSKGTTVIVKKLGFKVSYGCEEKVSLITIGDPDCLYNLGRFNRESGISTEDFFKNIV